MSRLNRRSGLQTSKRIIAGSLLWLILSPAAFPGTAASPTADAETAPSGSFLSLAPFRPDGPSDIVLIYQGGTDRLPWSAEQLAPYVSARASDGREHWLFDGFLFIEFRDSRGHDYASGFGHKPARQEDWLWLLERNFSPGTGVPALDQAIGSAVQRLGAPERPRQVILTLPQPIPSLTHWGTLNGRTVDFSNADDRVAACRWHVETALAKWSALHPEHLKLAGFYWVAEDATQDAAILPQVAEIVHAHGLRFFWIPYWRAGGAADWSKLGFDAAYQQPNHFFHPEVDDQRLDDACGFARTHHMGLEFELDKRACKSPDLFRPRLYSYLRAFDTNGVRNGGAMAYYEGGGALLDMFSSADPKCRADYQAIASWVIGRQSRQTWVARPARGRRGRSHVLPILRK
jgi:hypothetical protein